MGGINTIYINNILASCVRKGKSVVVDLMCVKNDIKCKTILICTFLDKSHQKLDKYVLNLQYISSLQEVEQDKTKETLV